MDSAILHLLSFGCVALLYFLLVIEHYRNSLFLLVTAKKSQEDTMPLVFVKQSIIQTDLSFDGKKTLRSLRLLCVLCVQKGGRKGREVAQRTQSFFTVETQISLYDALLNKNQRHCILLRLLGRNKQKQ